MNKSKVCHLLPLFLLFLSYPSTIKIVLAQPLQHRILIAISYDGIEWQRLNQIFCDSGDVPDAVIGPGNNVYVYFQGLYTPFIDGIMVGISPNGFDSWNFHQVQIAGTEGWAGHPCDPDIVFKNDTFRLYFTGDPINDMRPETYSAISTDGIHFTREISTRFEIAGSAVLDPSVLWTEDTLQYFAGGAPPGYNWHAHSIDGITFTRKPDFAIDSLLMANGIQVPGGYRFYGFKNFPHTSIYSVFSINGEVWSLEPGTRLTLNTSTGLESLYVKDPAVVFKDTVFIMYYVTRRPYSATSVKDIHISENSLRISPNPFNNFCTISLPEQTNMEILDLNGRTILKNKSLEKNDFIWYPDKSIPNGTYIVKIWNEKGITVKHMLYMR